MIFEIISPRVKPSAPDRSAYRLQLLRGGDGRPGGTCEEKSAAPAGALGIRRAGAATLRRSGLRRRNIIVVLEKQLFILNS
jgi:hypothetical protein